MKEKILGQKFATFTPYIETLSMKDFGSIDESGKVEEKPVYPFEVIFKPTNGIKDLFPNKLDITKECYQKDMCFDKGIPAFWKQLATVPEDINLYTIYALEKPKELGGKEELIGTLVLDGKLYTSKWGDETLFF